MTIPILDLKAEYKSIKGEIDDAVMSVLESGHFILGPNVSSFESEFAAYNGSKYAVAVASGTDALLLSLKALGIKEGDEVITSSLTFIATAEAISYTGANPVFVDVDPITHNIDPDKIEKAITKNTKAIIPVHLWGLTADMEKIMAIAKKHSLFVVEDCCQAVGAKFKGKRSGTFGDLGCFSFFPTKNLGAYGDGGIIVTDNPDLKDKLELLHLHGSKARGVHEMIGYNSRLDALQAAILRVKLKYIDSWNAKRRENAAFYTAQLEKIGIKCPPNVSDREHVYHQYTIEVNDRQMFSDKLSQKGVMAFVYYPTPLHLQKPYSFLDQKKGDLPVSEKIGDRMLSIPVHPFMTESDVASVARSIIEVSGR